MIGNVSEHCSGIMCFLTEAQKTPMYILKLSHSKSLDLVERITLSLLNCLCSFFKYQKTTLVWIYLWALFHSINLNGSSFIIMLFWFDFFECNKPWNQAVWVLQFFFFTSSLLYWLFYFEFFMEILELGCQYLFIIWGVILIGFHGFYKACLSGLTYER